MGAVSASPASCHETQGGGGACLRPLQELALNQAVLCEACTWPVIPHLDPLLVSLASKCRVPIASFQQRNVLGCGPRYLAWFRMRKLPGGVVSCLPRKMAASLTPRDQRSARARSRSSGSAATFLLGCLARPGGCVSAPAVPGHEGPAGFHRRGWWSLYLKQAGSGLACPGEGSAVKLDKRQLVTMGESFVTSS